MLQFPTKQTTRDSAPPSYEFKLSCAYALVALYEFADAIEAKLSKRFIWMTKEITRRLAALVTASSPLEPLHYLTSFHFAPQFVASFIAS